jgi:hypothetical protein
MGEDVLPFLQANFEPSAKVAVQTTDRIEIDHDAAMRPDERGRIELFGESLWCCSDQVFILRGDQCTFPRRADNRFPRS